MWPTLRFLPGLFPYWDVKSGGEAEFGGRSTGAQGALNGNVELVVEK